MTQPSAKDHGPEAHDSPPPPQNLHLRTIALAIAGTSVLLLFLSESFLVGDLSGDEASHVIMAQNITHDFDYFARPSITPLGDLDEKRNVVTFPPGDPLLRAGGKLMVGGAFVGSALVSSLAFAASLFFLYRLAQWLSPPSAPWTVLLAACSPGLFWLFGWQEAEPTMTAFGLGGTWLLVSGYRDRQGLRALGGGLLMGLAFVIKLYLIIPFLALVGVYVVARMITAKRVTAFDLRWLALALLGFMVAGSSHLLVVWALAPQELTFWIESVYFAPLSGTDSPLTDKLEGHLRNSKHNHPFWYYFAALYREHFILLPVFVGALLGSRHNWRSWLRPEALATACGVAAILLWSIPATKEPLYILPSSALLYLLGGWALCGGVKAVLTKSQLSLIAAVVFAGGLGILIAGMNGIKADDIDTRFGPVHTLVAIAAIGAVFAPPRQRTDWVPWLLAVVLVANFALSQLTAPPRENLTLADAMKNSLAHSEIRDISFLADNLNELQARLQRTGLMWKDLSDEELADPFSLLAEGGKLGTVRAFITTPELQADPRYSALLGAVLHLSGTSPESDRLLLRITDLAAPATSE